MRNPRLKLVEKLMNITATLLTTRMTISRTLVWPGFQTTCISTERLLRGICRFQHTRNQTKVIKVRMSTPMFRFTLVSQTQRHTRNVVSSYSVRSCNLHYGFNPGARISSRDHTGTRTLYVPTGEHSKRVQIQITPFSSHHLFHLYTSAYTEDQSEQMYKVSQYSPSVYCPSVNFIGAGQGQ